MVPDRPTPVPPVDTVEVTVDVTPAAVVVTVPPVAIVTVVAPVPPTVAVVVTVPVVPPRPNEGARAYIAPAPINSPTISRAIAVPVVAPLFFIVFSRIASFIKYLMFSSG
jgi:hypothetical protein